MGPTGRRIALVIVGLAAMLLLAPAAPAMKRMDPIAVAACDNPPCDYNAVLELPGTSTGDINIPTVGHATDADVSITAEEAGKKFYGLVDTVAAAFPSLNAVGKNGRPKYNRFAKVVFTCALVSFLSSISDDDVQQSLTLFGNADAAAIAVCIQIAAALPAPATPAAVAAAGGCFSAVKAVAARSERLRRRGYKVSVNAMSYTPRTRSPLIVACRRIGGTQRISIRPRKRGRMLLPLVGPRLYIGFVNPTHTPVTVHAHFRLR